MIYWFTGQPGAGKTTLARMMATHMHPFRPVIIDGDDIREIYQNKDYSEEGRKKNIKLAQDLSLFLHKKGMVAIVSLVSPFREQREEFKNLLGDDNIKEIYVHAFIDRGRTEFHVKDYEPPLDNFIDMDTTNDSEFQSYKKLLQNLNL